MRNKLRIRQISKIKKKRYHMKTRSKDLNPKGVLKKKIIPLPKPKKALKTKG